MDRLRRVLTGGTLVMVLGTVVAASGCRSMRSEVPPGKPYSTTGGTPPALGFNSDPRPNAAVGGGLYPNSTTSAQPGMPLPGQGSSAGLTTPDPMSPSSGSSAAQFGTPAPSTGNYGQPTANRYGPATTPGVAGSETGR
jgi:hypothetical protein